MSARTLLEQLTDAEMPDGDPTLAAELRAKLTALDLPTVTRLTDHGPFRRYELKHATADGRSCVVFFDHRGGGPHVEVAHFIGNRAGPLTWPACFESGRFRGEQWHTPTAGCRALLEAADAAFLSTESAVTP